MSYYEIYAVVTSATYINCSWAMLVADSIQHQNCSQLCLCEIWHKVGLDGEHQCMPLPVSYMSQIFVCYLVYVRCDKDVGLNVDGRIMLTVLNK